MEKVIFGFVIRWHVHVHGHYSQLTIHIEQAATSINKIHGGMYHTEVTSK